MVPPGPAHRGKIKAGKRALCRFASPWQRKSSPRVSSYGNVNRSNQATGGLTVNVRLAKHNGGAPIAKGGRGDAGVSDEVEFLVCGNYRQNHSKRRGRASRPVFPEDPVNERTEKRHQLYLGSGGIWCRRRRDFCQFLCSVSRCRRSPALEQGVLLGVFVAAMGTCSIVAFKRPLLWDSCSASHLLRAVVPGVLVGGETVEARRVRGPRRPEWFRSSQYDRSDSR